MTLNLYHSFLSSFSLLSLSLTSYLSNLYEVEKERTFFFLLEAYLKRTRFPYRSFVSLHSDNEIWTI